ncbi:MAG: hypothetical protein ABI688_11390, partial [Bacteroidota bacterium]
MAEKKSMQELDADAVVAKAKDFWSKFSKPVMIISSVIIVAVGGWYIYQNYVKKPKEEKAT